MSSISSFSAPYFGSVSCAASSSSSFPSSAPPPLDLSRVSGMVRLFEKLTGSDRSSLSSSERQKGKTISRSESYQPLKIPSLGGDSPKRSASLMPRMFLSERELEKVKQVEIMRVRKALMQFYGCLNRKNALNPDYIMVLDNKKYHPSWRNLTNCSRKRFRLYQGRAEKALWNLVSQVETFLDSNMKLLTVTDRVGKERTRVKSKVSVNVLFDKCIKNPSLLQIINRNENLRYKISRCYLRAMMNALYEDCASICQTLDEFENYELIEGLETLRRITNQPVIEILINSELLENVPVKTLLLECRATAQEIINRTLATQEQVQGRISRGENLKLRLMNTLNLGEEPGLMTTLNFEEGFRGFVESTLIFLSSNFREDLAELHVDLAKIISRLNDGIRKPYKWTELRTVLTQLNYIVSKLVRKHNDSATAEIKKDEVIAIPKKKLRKSRFSVQQDGFMGTPRNGSLRRL